MSDAQDDKRCNNCKHQAWAEDNNWCYMFSSRPDSLPCGQHDRFAEMRRKNGAEFLKELGG
jgi:hypothetical protein